MSRTAVHHALQKRDRFRWRNHEVSRIEGLSDAVFAFAITLLIVSLEVPRTFSELYETMRGFLPFAVVFALLLNLWHTQFIWFRRYGLQDTASVVLNGTLLFLVLFYVYPLKFLFQYLFRQLLGESLDVRLADGRVVPMLSSSDGYLMMIIYGAGFCGVFLLFAVLYWYALSKSDHLQLTALERHDTISRIGGSLLNVAVGLISLATIFIGGSKASGTAGLVYMLIGPLLTVYYSLRGRKARKLESTLAT